VRIGQSHGNRAGSFAWTHVVDAGLVALETLNTFLDFLSIKCRGDLYFKLIK